MKYPLGIQSFPNIIEGDYAYIDKTALINQLVSSGKWYFLSRPRRFGKSLLVSTFEALFECRRELFKGLAIAEGNYDWVKRPVIKLEFTKRKVQSAAELEELLLSAINGLAKQYSLTLSNTSSALRFDELVKALYAKYRVQVVLLVDEYDKPILDCLNTSALEEIKATLNGFYAMVKTLDEYLSFTFITGVSKFSHVSVFSGMNNLTDISMDRRYATLCGYVESEITEKFAVPLSALAKEIGCTDASLIHMMRDWYNGYCFHPEAKKVYNPYSVLSLLAMQEFKNYWYKSATPTFLLALIKSRQTDLSQLENFEVGENAFNAVEPEQLDLLAVLLQTGYLTIKGYDAPLYQLGFPNKEVKDSFYESLAADYSSVAPSLTQAYAVKMHRALERAELDAFFDQLKIFLAGVSYEITLKNEKYYQSLIFVICKLLGFTAEVEVSTNKGRIDAVIQTDKTIYIIEFKLNGTKEQALEQIQNKQYYQKYQDQGRAIHLVGVEFDPSERNIGGWLESVVRSA